MSGKFALIIGNTEYADPGLAQLTAPGRDVDDFGRVLKEPDLCGFDDVKVFLNKTESIVREAIDEFFEGKTPDDLLVLYFSGHGVRDEVGSLYLAVKNTNRYRLRSTAIKSDFIREAMDGSRSKRQVLILDCCNSGAFSQGSKAATGMSIGTATAFEVGYGRVILTASDSTQFAWEGDKVIGETDNSLFTHYLVEGLEGEADRDGDGHITVDELYDYAYEKVRIATPKQTPSKFATKQQGEIVLRGNIRVENIKPVPLPDDLIAAIKSSLPFVREGAVRQLEDLLRGKNLGLARSAQEALERIAEDDDSKIISRAAFQVLGTTRQAEKNAEEERIAKLEAERLVEEISLVEEAERQRLAAQKAEEERIAKVKLEAGRLAEEKRHTAEKAEAERKNEEERIAKAKMEAVRLSAEKAGAEQKAKEEAERLIKQKAEEERLAKAKLVADRLAEEKRRSDEKAEAELKSKEEAERFVQQKLEEALIEKAKLKAEQKGKPSYWKAVGLHLLFGFGLFYLDTQLKRKWLYPALVFYAVLDYILGPELGIEPFASDAIGFTTFLIAIGLYILSFIDVIVACKNRRRGFG